MYDSLLSPSSLMHLFRLIIRLFLALLVGAAIGLLVSMAIIMIGLNFKRGDYAVIAWLIGFFSGLGSAGVSFLWLVDRAWQQYLRERAMPVETQQP